MANKNIDESDLVPAPKLIGIVLQTCKGQVDQWVEPYLRITLDRLRGAEKSSFKCLLIEVVSNLAVVKLCFGDLIAALVEMPHRVLYFLIGNNR